MSFDRLMASFIRQPAKNQTMPSVYIKTYGCQMNERDSEAVRCMKE